MISTGPKLSLDRGSVQILAPKRLVQKHLNRPSLRSGVLCLAASDDAASPEPADAPASDQPAQVPLSEILPGQVYQGTVKGIAAYGCFVDIGSSTDGLVHISQLSSGYVKDINAFVKVGQKVQVKVLGVEGKNKIALSMKTGADEGAGEGAGEQKRAPRMRKNAAKEHGLSVGDKVKGEVMRIASFGAFLKLEDGFEVLLPTAEMSAAEDLDPNPHTLVTVGNMMDVTVMKVDGSKVSVTAISEEDRASMAEASQGASSEGASAAVGGSMFSDLAALGMGDMFAAEPAAK